MLHAEYVALSQSLRDLLPIGALITEIMAGMKTDTKKLEFISKSTVYVKNNGAIRVVTYPRLPPSSKFIAVKYHWFRQHVQSEEVKFVKVDFSKLLAGAFTKGLQGETFFTIQKLLCG
eukprot:9441539-Ditylum_brightwellii.AAC.1